MNDIGKLFTLVLHNFVQEETTGFTMRSIFTGVNSLYCSDLLLVHVIPTSSKSASVYEVNSNPKEDLIEAVISFEMECGGKSSPD